MLLIVEPQLTNVEEVRELESSHLAIDSGETHQQMLKLWGENLVRHRIFTVSKYFSKR